jgi:hypothetical protein
MPPARYANAPIIQISTAYHHIDGRADRILPTVKIDRLQQLRSNNNRPNPI